MKTNKASRSLLALFRRAGLPVPAPVVPAPVAP